MVRWAVGDGWGAGWGAGWVEAAGALDSLHALACPKHPICLWHRGKTRSFSCQSCLCKHLKARVVPVRGVSIGGAPVPPRARAQRRCTRRRHVLHPPLFHHVSNHIFPLMHACFFHFLEQEMTRAAAQAQEKREREQRWEREAAQRAETMERLINFKSAPRAAPTAPHLVDSLRIDQPHAMRSLTEGRTEGSPEAETGVGGGRGGGVSVGIPAVLLGLGSTVAVPTSAAMRTSTPTSAAPPPAEDLETADASVSNAAVASATAVSLAGVAYLKRSAAAAASLSVSLAGVSAEAVDEAAAVVSAALLEEIGKGPPIPPRPPANTRPSTPVPQHPSPNIRPPTPVPQHPSPNNRPPTPVPQHPPPNTHAQHPPPTPTPNPPP